MCAAVRIYHLVLLFVSVAFGTSARARHAAGRQALKYYGHGLQTSDDDAGLWPNVFNVATKAIISANATCGEGGREEFCRLTADGRRRCSVCDNFSPDLGKRHLINYAINDTNLWWQSPTLMSGPEYEYVTVTLDLKQVYQVAYVIMKAANSPRPGSWILERSEDGDRYEPWQYFATSDKDCWERYGVSATKGKPRYQTDTEVICTSSYSKLLPLENGEIHISFMSRPGANETSPELLQFTRARYVRFRLQGHRASVEPLPRWLSLAEPNMQKRLFYSIKDINIVGQCVCNGHASSCRHNVASGHPECECVHHTCGPNCDRCCPLYNQRPWGAGSSRDARLCLPCQCHGHATSCHYDEAVDNAGLSVDINGDHNGGGVCDNCTAYTTGINCERCIRGYFRPDGVPASSEVPCIRCDCNSDGSTGLCTQEGPRAGTCECLPGFAGFRCDRCDAGYRGFPNCETCPCDARGLVPTDDCEGECICKANVDGKNCDRCKPGYFALQGSNFEGCSSCYCSGVTNLCESAIIEHRTIETLEEWLISDISVSDIVKPTLDSDTNWLSIGNYEFPGIEAYYWLAPKEYCGNKLETYDTELKFKLNWVVMRGDTSGKPTTGPNVILVGANGLRIAHGDQYFTDPNATISVRLNEHGWYHVPKDVKDIVTRLRRTEYRGDPVNRRQFMSVLINIKYILLRAKFHTDQIEGSLETAVMNLGSSEAVLGYGAVERCSCPSGYTGLSCESCDYGYVRIVANNSAHQEQSYCVKCDCNGHSRTCDADTGDCACEHDTIGEKCERCSPGFYGNPLTGFADACKRCACPLLNEENNFSPSCQLDVLDLDVGGTQDGYVCTQCPKGYTGDHCEICDDGYFGDPTEVGGKCEPCSCGGSPCDRITGQCLSCRGNTEGWRCERCKAEHFGDPTVANCQECLCDSLGSTSRECDGVTGQCLCKERRTGRTCDKCETGFGNVTAGCTPCTCNATGSLSNVCNPQTGLCDCKDGVEGFHCDACQHLHYNFSETGCHSCNCFPQGSELPQCDIVHGYCRCKVNYEGRTCHQCKAGYWNSQSGTCTACDCDKDGAEDNICDDASGRCRCKYGIGGDKCNICLKNYYRFSPKGCKDCEPCTKEGHVCDPDTGRCVCPPLTRGELCQHCVINAWGYEPQKGCKACNCSVYGSSNMQCNVTTGACCCRQGFTGELCDRCDYGYFGYPRCRRCSCNFDGTNTTQCRIDGLCNCEKDTGKCLCKSNVIGQRCDRCVDGTFGLHQDNLDGCTQCFCFGRTTNCSDAGLTWDHIRLRNSREFSTQEVSKIDAKDNYLGVSRNEIMSLDKLQIIPGRYENISVEAIPFDEPLYWKLPPEFHGDRILSYGGYIRFTSDITNPNDKLPMAILRTYPIIQIKGNGIILEHILQMNISSKYEVRLHESFWDRKYSREKYSRIDRKQLMIVLQKVEHVLIRATDSRKFTKVILSEVTWDTAIEVPGNPPPYAKGVELCECPRQYNSSSCQNPSIGFFRWYNPKSSDSTIVIIGEARECECNGRSNICDIETGDCLECTDNTSGKSCEKCAEGFYGDPIYGTCQPCPCPRSNQNFAVSCTPKPGRAHHNFHCQCKPGYTGHTCERCSQGYFGHPKVQNGSCQPCNCNLEGVTDDKCHAETGQCNCKPGVTGKQCSRCEKPRHILENRTCVPCDKCIDWLLDDYEDLEKVLSKYSSYIVNASLQPPWDELNLMKSRYETLSDQFDNYINSKDGAIDFNYKPLKNLESTTKRIKQQMKKYTANATSLIQRSEAVQRNSTRHLKEVIDIDNRLNDLIKRLRDFGNSSHLNKQDALKKARKLFQAIKAERHKLNPDLSTLKRCQEIKDLLDNLISKNENTEKIRNELKDIKESLGDFDVLLNNIQKQNSDTALKNEKNGKTIRSINETLINLRTKHSNLEDDISTIKEHIKRGQDSLNEAQNNVNNLANSNEFEVLLRNVEDKEQELSSINPEYMKLYVEPVQKHVEYLQEMAREYASAFNKSTATINAYNASRAYGRINDAISEADSVARDTAKLVVEAEKTISPKGKDSLYDQTYISIGDSDRLKERANNLNTHINELKQKIDHSKLKIQTLRDSIWGNGIKNKEEDAEIAAIKSTINLSDLEKIIYKADKSTEDMRQIYKYAHNTYLDTFYKLERQDLEKIKKLHIPEVNKNILNTRKQLEERVKENITKPLEHLSDNLFKEKTDRIAQQLELLKSTIKKGRQLATGIQVALGNSCARKYSLYLEPSAYTDIAVIFNRGEIPKDEPNSSIFYLETQYKQFMALEIVNNDLRFIWKVGSNTNVLKQKLVHNNNESLEVLIERRGKNTQLKIKQPNADTLNVTKYDETEADAIFNLGPLDKLYVGQIPDNVPVDAKLKAKSKLNVCLQSIVINKKKIGLWNFEKQFSDSCAGCAISNLIKSENFFFFEGDGYANISVDQRKSTRDRINIHFQLTTLDENAIVFIAVDPSNQQSISVTLEKGHLIYKSTYNNHPPSILRSHHKFNNGNWISVSILKDLKIRSSTLRIKDLSTNYEEEIQDEINSNIIASDLLPFRKSHVQCFFGGIPPNFKYTVNNYAAIMSTDVSLLGGLKQIFDVNLMIRPVESHLSYGVQIMPEGATLSYTKAWFDERGKLEMNDMNSQNFSTVQFMFRTKKENAVLMVIAKHLFEEKKNYCFIAIENGRIRFEEKNESQGFIKLFDPHSKIVNDNNFHSLMVRKNKTRTELLIDGESIKSVEGGTIDGNNGKMSIYFGYLPEGFSDKESELSTLSFNGSIKDIILDDNPIKFDKDTIRSFENVWIGRSGPEVLNVAPLDMKMGDMMPTSRSNLEGCRKIGSYLLEPAAVKFGDTLSEDSFVIQYLKPETFWNKEFHLEFELRTFYPTGLLLITPPRTSKHHIVLDLKEGKLHFSLQLKRKKGISVPVKVDDGKWHRVIIKSTKLKRRTILTMMVDEKSSKNKPIKIPKKLNVARRMYIGSIPKELLTSTFNSINQFRGCVRGLKINYILQDMVSDVHSQHSIGQCFPNVEKGSYFAGDAYAIYKNNFQVSKSLELSFEFRTSEQSGILLTVSNPGNRPALSVELYNGSVLMTADAGDGEASQVENGLDSPFSLCNNEWHSVTALYSTREMTINVDGVRRSWVRANGTPLEEQIEAPLYVGGLPDGALTGTLKTRENFKGCIRNIKIGDKIVDWIDMDELNNVLLNSCPVM